MVSWMLSEALLDWMEAGIIPSSLYFDLTRRLGGNPLIIVIM